MTNTMPIDYIQIPYINKIIILLVPNKWNIIHYQIKKSEVNTPNKDK
jgi:hypothetical protein